MTLFSKTIVDSWFLFVQVDWLECNMIKVTKKCHPCCLMTFSCVYRDWLFALRQFLLYNRSINFSIHFAAKLFETRSLVSERELPFSVVSSMKTKSNKNCLNIIGCNMNVVKKVKLVEGNFQTAILLITILIITIMCTCFQLCPLVSQLSLLDAILLHCNNNHGNFTGTYHAKDWRKEKTEDKKRERRRGASQRRKLR